jgi:hypothetical protein
VKNINKFSMIKWAGSIVLAFLAFKEFYNLNILPYVGSQNIWDSKRFIAFLVVSALFVFFALYCLVLILRKRNPFKFITVNKSPGWLNSAIPIFLILLPGLVKWILPLPVNFAIGFWMEFFIVFLIAFLIVYLFDISESPWQELIKIGCYILLAGAGHAIFYKLSQVTNYPFTLYWSEGNRFFDYSALFGKNRYNLPDGEGIKAFTTWGMQLPWALPFVIPNLSIGFFRFWYQLMWILPTFVLGVVASYQIKAGKSTLFLVIVFASWTFLFLDQGPIYAPLVLGAILTLIAVRTRLLSGFLIILAASFYTHSARWTWSYAPGLWAGLLTLLEIENPALDKRGLKNLIKPVTLGVAGYLGGQLFPSLIKSFNSSASVALLPDAAASTSRQPLLWDRLFPNPTFPPGILWALVWATLPVILLMVILNLQKEWRTNWLQNLALLTVSGAFLAVGIIASVKIGGGSNLHNLDMFLMSLVIIASGVLVSVIKKKENLKYFSPVASLMLFLSLVSPVTFSFIGGERLALPPNEKITEALAAVQNKVEQYSRQGKILFIDHRQLLTFNLVDKVPLFDEYEKKYLMDQAMADNKDYFIGFYKDLAEKRFALIVNEPTNMVIRGSEYSFGEENDAYVKWVTIPLLCNYEPLYSSPETSVELLIPRKAPPPENLNCSLALTALD